MKKIRLTEADLTRVIKRIVKEAPIDYGDYPERMDPNLERKFGDPEGMYAKNPAFRKGSADIERLAGGRFKEVVDRVRSAFNRPNVSSQQVKNEIIQQMMMITGRIMSIESQHNEELKDLALELALEETGTDRDWYQFDLTLGNADSETGMSEFRMKPQEKPKFELPKSFELDVETDEEQFQSEVDKRNIINLIIQGEAKKGHYSFMKPSFMQRVAQIDSELPNLYRQVMAANDLLYFTMEQMIEMMSQTGQGVAGKSEIQDADDEEGGEGEEGPDTKIVAAGMIFPILLHEIIKGLEEAPAREQFSQMDPERASNIMGQTDVLSNEPMQLRLGPSVVELIKFALPDEMFEPENSGLNPWFKKELYKIPAKEFLNLIGDAISEDKTEKDRARKKFTEVMKAAQNAKREYDEYNQGKEQDDLDDFLASL
ncbi:hypothetical protein EBU94_02950 [bacterium]|jgi:hypothetical protein|nr:hypothetical protein [bacterium]